METINIESKTIECVAFYFQERAKAITLFKIISFDVAWIFLPLRHLVYGYHNRPSRTLLGEWTGRKVNVLDCVAGA